MINIITKGLALCGLCTLIAGAASAQGDFQHHDSLHHGAMRHAIVRQKQDYARAVAHGHYGAAERAHLRAMAIRHHARVQHEMRRDHREMHRDHSY